MTTLTSASLLCSQPAVQAVSQHAQTFRAGWTNATNIISATHLVQKLHQ